jgi:hypothetical protein
MIKECKVCKIEKDRLLFYKDKNRSDGLARECKDCCNERKKKFREQNRIHVNRVNRENAKKHVKRKSEYEAKRYAEKKEEICKKNRESYQLNREKIRKRQNELHKTSEYREKNRERQRKWYKRNSGKIKKYINKWVSENRHKVRAHYAISDAIRRGKMIRPNQCEQCKIECKPDGHHEDYNKPLEVKWLCKICHAKETFNL